MCRPLRENLQFGGNAMYRTPSGSVRYIVFAIRRIYWPYVLR